MLKKSSKWFGGKFSSIFAPSHGSSQEQPDLFQLKKETDIGRIFMLGKQPVNAQVKAYYNVEKPEYGPDWQLQFQLQLMFPK